MTLTNSMRHYLGTAQPAPYLHDVVRQFMARFGLTAEAAAELIGQWIRETQ